MTCLHFAVLGLLSFQAPAGKVEVLNCWNVALATNQHTHSPSPAAPWTAWDLSRLWHSQGFHSFHAHYRAHKSGFCGKLMNKAVSSS